jgi:leucyl aminopeptidase
MRCEPGGLLPAAVSFFFQEKGGRMHRTMLLASTLLLAGAPLASAHAGWLTVAESALLPLRAQGIPFALVARRPANVATKAEPIYLVKIDDADLPALAGTLHRALRHCGGFMYHDSEAEGRSALDGALLSVTATRPSYAIGNAALVKPTLAQMDDKRIGDTIVKLSGFPNRYFNSEHGKAASDWLRARWAELGARHPGVTVAHYAHKGYGQPSVIATIAGSDKAEQVIVLGAHLDSINIASPGNAGKAPGADDDASGVAGLTEVLRVLAESDYKPRRTIKLIAYAAEEVGLRGSQDIAREHKRNGIDVVGVLQLDMTNYKGSNKDVVLISDYTDAAQNAFLGKLLASYLPALTVGMDQCGYACSDHAAWNAQGFATSMPFESMLREDNPKIHTKDDSYAASGNQAVHALKFARLAAAYAIELGSEVP